MVRKKTAVDRYDRQKRIPGWDQAKLKRSRVFVAGMGALGNEVAKNLALAGVGTLLLLDFDRVEYTNLNRTVLFSDRDVGAPKVVAASRAIARLNRTTKVIALNQRLQELLERSDRVLRGADLLVGCLDNREARFILNHFSVLHRIPYVDGGMLNTVGGVRVSVPPYTPCLECGIPRDTYAQVGQRYRCEEIVFEDLTAKQMAIRHPTISTVTSVTAAIQSHEALKIIVGLDRFRSQGTWAEGIGKPIENEIQYDCKTNNSVIHTFRKDVECYVCGTHGSSIDPVKSVTLPVGSGDRVSDMIVRVQSSLRTKEFNLTKGLKPFPDRAAVVSEVRNLFQRLFHLSRLLAKATVSESDAQEPYRILHKCLESGILRGAQDTIRKGIPFRPDDIVKATHIVRHAAGSLRSSTLPSMSDFLPALREIDQHVSHILRSVGDDLTVEECGLANRDILCAIRSDGSRLHDTVIEVAVR